MASPDFRTILSDIKKGNFAPVYFLQGDEPYYLDKLTEALENAVVPADERDFNLNVFYGKDNNLEGFITAAQQYPFMADRRLVVMKETQALDRAKDKLEGLTEYFLRPNPQTVMVLVYKGETIAANSKILKAIAKGGGVLFTSKQFRDYQMAPPIREYMRSKRIGIDEKAVSLLVDNLGTSLTKIFGEIDKLIVAGGQDLTTITADLIEKHTGLSKDFNNWELTSALAVKDYVKAMTIVNYFAENPKKNPTVVTTGTLFGFFSKLIMAHFSREKTDSALMAAMGLSNSYALREYKAALRNYNAMQTLNAIHLLRKFDAESKGIGSMQDEYQLLTELIFNIFSNQGQPME